MEVDAFLVLVLAVYDVRLLRRLGVAARHRAVPLRRGVLDLPWLRAPAPPRYWAKVVAAIQGMVLTVADGGRRAALAGGDRARRRAGPGRRVVRAPDRLAVVRTGPQPADRDGRCVADPARRRCAGWPRARPPSSPARSSGSRCVAPNDARDLAVGAFVRIPIEALVVVGLVLVLPPRAGRILVLAVGAVLGVLTVVKLLDMGFLAALNRPFDPLSDWSYIGPGIPVLGDSIGRLGAVVRGRRRRGRDRRRGGRWSRWPCAGSPGSPPGTAWRRPGSSRRSPLCGWSARSSACRSRPAHRSPAPTRPSWRTTEVRPDPRGHPRSGGVRGGDRGRPDGGHPGVRAAGRAPR